MTWESRIVGEGTENPSDLLANPRNWRVHPKAQQDVLAGLLTEVGWVQRVIVNQRTGHVIDGHLRVSLAIARDETSIPVVYVDLSIDEEALVLAVLDPIASMATTDTEALVGLLEDITVGDQDLTDMLARLRESEPLLPGFEDPEEKPHECPSCGFKWTVGPRGGIHPVE